MKEYIARQDIIDTLDFCLEEAEDTQKEIVKTIKVWVERIPVADAVEQKRGEMKEYAEIVERLRTATTLPVMNTLCQEAADAIEDLFAELRMEKVDNINLTGQLVEEHAKRQWISVKDRLPSQDGYYLVAYKLDVIPQRWHFNVYPFSLDLYNTDKFDFPRKKYKGKSGFYFYDSEYGYCEDSRVTHWMPLPQPPKEGKPHGN